MPGNSIGGGIPSACIPTECYNLLQNMLKICKWDANQVVLIAQSTSYLEGHQKAINLKHGNYSQMRGHQRMFQAHKFT